MSKWIVDIHGEIEGDFDLICKAESVIPLDKVKQARDTIQYMVDNCGSDTVAALNMQGSLKAALAVIDKLIAESEGT